MFILHQSRFSAFQGPKSHLFVSSSVAPFRRGQQLHLERPGVCGPGCVETRAMPDLCVRQRHGDVR